MKRSTATTTKQAPISKSLTQRIPTATLALACVLIIIRGLEQRGKAWFLDGPLWDLQQSSAIKALLLELAMAGLTQAILYAIIGFLVIQCAPAIKNKSLAPARSLQRALTFAIVLSAFVSMLSTSIALQAPNLLDMILPCIGSLVGAWIGLSWAQKAPLWIVAKLALLTGLGLAAITVLLFLAIETNPPAFEPPELVSADRVRLTKLIRSKSPRTIPNGQTVTLSLTERDINLLFAWGLSLGSSGRKARIELANYIAAIQGSIRLPGNQQSPRYLNVLVIGHAGVHEGIFELSIESLKIGRLDIPKPLLWLLAPALAQKIQNEPLLAPMLAQIQYTEIVRSFISGTYQRINMPEGFRNDIFGPVGPEQQVFDALSRQFDQISKLANSMPPDQQEFGTFLRAAFTLANERSQQFDPVVENRAAIIALGISLGHTYIGEFVGTLPHKKVPKITHSLSKRVKLRGRVDWSRHFLVSAALEVISSESVSLDIGVLKEELDAGTAGGSGFSFADLSADRSGTMFGKVATANVEAAIAIQQRLRREFKVNDYFPESKDLPENIPQRQLQKLYGGVNGRQYQRLLKSIDKRISACAAYRSFL